MNTSWSSSASQGWSGRTTRFEETDSTNERALAAVASGDARHGDVFVARAQTRGRGRRGAAWHSPAGEGLYFSVVLLPGAPAFPAALTMASGVAVWRALRDLGLASVELRWPNDLFVGRAKLVGILVETRGLDPAAPHYVVGIGINVAQRAFAPELVAERAVTSLALEGVATTVDAVLARVVAELEPALERALADPEATAREYAEAARLLGAPVRVEVPGERVSAGSGERSTEAAGVLVGHVRAFGAARGVELVLDSGEVRRLALEHIRGLARL
ncbi:MAG: biotin--[acetyl-CoA-carboxylase] ligase [Planctomycetes bacterium]|nr:biotin--[acetyl-CoA-carboxylase] ligase [Planctomycetota bacterium]